MLAWAPMRPTRPLLPALVLLTLFVGIAAAGTPPAKPAPAKPAAPAAKPAAPGAAASPPAKLEDRVMAVVDEDPILASDLERVIALGLKQPNPGEADVAFRRRVLNDLIEERLRFHEIDRFGFGQVPVADIDAHVAEIRARFKDEATFQKALQEHGLTLKALRQLASRMLLDLN